MPGSPRVGLLNSEESSGLRQDRSVSLSRIDPWPFVAVSHPLQRKLAPMMAAPVRASVRNHVRVPLRFADGFEAVAEVFTFYGLVDGKEHLALRFDEDNEAVATVADRPLVRIHSECMTGDVFGSLRCDCGPQLRESIERISALGGYVLYLRQEGRGIGLYSKLDAYRLQDNGLDTFAANRALGREDDERVYTVAAQMLQALDVHRIDLLSNNPDKGEQLEALGIDVVQQVPTGVHVSNDNHAYLTAKVAQHAHTIDVPAQENIALYEDRDDHDRASVDRVLTTTRAVRRRLDLTRLVEPALIDECLELALQAPNGSGAELWRFIVVTDQSVRQQLGELYKKSSDAYLAQLRQNDPNLDETTPAFRSSQQLWEHLGDVPVHVVPCLQLEAWHQTSKQLAYVNASVYGTIFPAMWSFQLACRSRGLGSCFVTSLLKFDDEFREILRLPADFAIGGLVAVAHTSGSFSPAKRRPLDEVRRTNGWS